MWKRVLIFGIVLSAICLGGCQIVDEKRVHKNGGDNLPWNGQADWEGSSTGGMGVAY